MLDVNGTMKVALAEILTKVSISAEAINGPECFDHFVDRT